MCAHTATQPMLGRPGDRPGDGGVEHRKGEREAGEGQTFSLPLEGAVACRAARAFTRMCLSRWGVHDRDQFGEDAVLVVSELVANAHQHAEAAEALRLRWQPPLLVIEVQDRGQGMPRIREMTDDLPGGRGLSIVAGLVHRCQVVLGTVGRKTVRVEMT